MKQDAASFQNPAAHSLPGSASEQAGESEEEPPGTTACPENVVPLPDIAPRTHGNVAVFPVPKSRPSLSTRANVFRRTFFPTATEKDWNDWQWQIRNRIRHLDQLERMLSLSHPERSAVEMIQSKLPVGITPYYMSLLSKDDACDPLRRTVVPTTAEFTTGPGEADDPLGEDDAQPGAGPGAPLPGPRAAPRDRLLLDLLPLLHPLARRRRTARIHPSGAAPRAGARRTSAPRRRSATCSISGGDPLTLSDERLDWILSRAAARSRTSRSSASAPRCPAVLPQRITPRAWRACCAGTTRSG